jgi:hypothetical protein
VTKGRLAATVSGAADALPDEVAVVPPEARETIEELLAASAPPHVIVAGKIDEATFRALIELGVSHIINTRAETAERDLAATIAKLTSGELFGLDPYVDRSSATSRYTCRAAGQRDELFDWIREFTDHHRVRRSILDMLLVVADEMVTNALYNAPVDANGARPNAALSRMVKVELAGAAEVVVELRCDGQRLGIATTDPFGSLDRDVVLGSLLRCFDRAVPRAGTGGAGLGLYMFVSSVTHAIVNVAPGRCTEVIGLLNVSGGFRTLVTSGKSFNLFVGS